MRRIDLAKVPRNMIGWKLSHVRGAEMCFDAVTLKTTPGDGIVVAIDDRCSFCLFPRSRVMEIQHGWLLCPCPCALMHPCLSCFFPLPVKDTQIVGHLLNELWDILCRMHNFFSMNKNQCHISHHSQRSYHSLWIFILLLFCLYREEIHTKTTLGTSRLKHLRDMFSSKLQLANDYRVPG